MGSLTCGGRSHRMPQTSGRRRGRPRKRKHEAAEPKLLEAILNPANLEGAWRSVKANAGAAGIDGMSVEAFPAYWQKDRERIVAQLKEGSYRPAAVRRVWIPKGNGEERPLGVPTVLDRVIQQAIAQILSLIFEGQFSAHSHGFRPGRRAQDAVKSIQEAAREGYVHAVDCDLKSFFDKVNHGELMQRLRRRIQDGRVLHLIGCYLKAGVRLPDGKTEATPAGVPQGGPLSPLLANIMLDDLDHELERRGHRFARYADDFIIVVKSKRAAERVMRSHGRALQRCPVDGSMAAAAGPALLLETVEAAEDPIPEPAQTRDQPQHDQTSQPVP